MDKVLGIDLGTTYSCVATVVDGSPMVIANKGGYRTTPSMVAVTSGGRRLVGHLAKRQAITNAQQTVFGAKRLIGRRWESEIVQEIRAHVPYKLAEGPHNDVRIELGEKVYSVPEISAMVLVEMKKVAEDFLGTKVEKAVVTVPAYFVDSQRQSTKDAGRIAGLEVLRIINEPTAAALAYGYGKKMDKRIAVFDLGGGTFDISILDIGGSVYEVIATAGDTFLGGEDFDNRVADWIVFGFAKEHGVDLREDPMAMQRVKDAAEKAKCELSFQNETELSLPFLYTTGKGKTLHFQKVLTRAKLEELTADLVDRTTQICEKTLREAGIRPDSIADVILVGGQSRMPRVQREVSRFFDREPSKNVHPDEVVALGASIQAYSLVTPAKKKEEETLLLDVTPHALGIMIVGGYFQKIIEKNTTVPTSTAHIFTTVQDRQTSVRIMVFQGESRVANENELMGEFILTGLREAPRGEVKIEVSFDISAEGIVSVAAKDLETGRAQSIVVTASSGLTEDEIKHMTEENRDYLLQSTVDEQFEKSRSDAEALLGELEKLMPEVTRVISNSRFSSDALRKAETVMERARTAIERKDAYSLADAMEGLKITMNTFRSLASRQK